MALIWEVYFQEKRIWAGPGGRGDRIENGDVKALPDFFRESDIFRSRFFVPAIHTFREQSIEGIQGNE